MFKYVLPGLALAGLAFAIFTVVGENSPAREPDNSLPTATAPFASYVEGSGILEARSGNISIGTPVSGIVSAIYVTRGEKVDRGARLFKIDDRDVRGRLMLAVAKVSQAEAGLAKAKSLYRISAGLKVGVGISKAERESRRHDVAIGAAALKVAQAEVQRLRGELARHTVVAPTVGRVLQINTHVGEFAQSGVLKLPLLLFGDDSRLYLRVNIDQDDAWRVRASAPAVAFVRGNPNLKVRLKFVRFNPYIVPKPFLNGSSTERSDLRVLQVIYSFDHAALPVYVGQQMDAFIKAPPLPGITRHVRDGKPS